jgi:3'-phosphoadenosine 5'-phosphosulfate sulfotransferase (PAPS reductase)/FAD synthetase
MSLFERDENGVLHVVAVSGGKDSTCLALALLEREPRPYTYVCTPTGDELPEMFEHLRQLGARLGKRILPIMAHTGLKGLVREQKAIPNARMRFCTRILKIEPYRRWLAEQAKIGPVVSYVGLRADEEGRAGGAYDDIDGVTMRFPLREWGMKLADVWAFLDQRGVSIPERTDCARCYEQRLGEWWNLWHDHPTIWMDIEQEELDLGHTWRSPTRDTWPARLADLRAEFEKGRIPPRTRQQRDLLRNIGQCRVCTL